MYVSIKTKRIQKFDGLIGQGPVFVLISTQHHLSELNNMSEAQRYHAVLELFYCECIVLRLGALM